MVLLFSGISGLDLCLPNCTWVDHHEEMLHLMDAGTDMGVRYNVDNFESEVKEKDIVVLSRVQNDQKIYVNQLRPLYQAILPIIDRHSSVRIEKTH